MDNGQEAGSKRYKSILINKDIHMKMKSYCVLKGTTIKRFIEVSLAKYMEVGKEGGFFTISSQDRESEDLKSLVIPAYFHSQIEQACTVCDAKIKDFTEQGIMWYLEEKKTNKIQ